jgi:RNA polymerase sigma factor (sigma-70 family)
MILGPITFDSWVSLSGFHFLIVQPISYFFSFFLLTTLFKELSDEELVKFLTKRTPEWGKIWEEFKRRFDEVVALYIYCALRRYSDLNNYKELDQTVKDLRQDVYIKLIKKRANALRKFRGEHAGSFRTYLRTTSINIVRNHVRKLSREKHAIEKHFFISGDTNSRDGDPAASPAFKDLELEFLKDSIIQALKDCYHSRNLGRDLLLFRLHFFEGLSAAEIYERYSCKVNISQHGIETTLSRMKIALEKFLF